MKKCCLELRIHLFARILKQFSFIYLKERSIAQFKITSLHKMFLVIQVNQAQNMQKQFQVCLLHPSVDQLLVQFYLVNHIKSNQSVYFYMFIFRLLQYIENVLRNSAENSILYFEYQVFPDLFVMSLLSNFMGMAMQFEILSILISSFNGISASNITYCNTS